MLYIVVPTFNRPQIFERFVEQMMSQTYKDFQIVAVDHGTKKVECTVPQVTLLTGSPDKWWTGAVNIGLEYILAQPNVQDGEHVLVINDDISIKNDYLENCVKSIKAKPDSCIGTVCYELKTNNTLHVNMLLNKRKADFEYKHKGVPIESLDKDFYESDVLKGRGTIFPIIVLRKVGIYNERKLPHYRADHELTWRAKQSGYEVVVASNMQIGAELNSPHRYDKSKGVMANYKSIFLHRVSTQNIKDLWNYSVVSFSPTYALYYYAVNMLRSHAVFLRTIIRK